MTRFGKRASYTTRAPPRHSKSLLLYLFLTFAFCGFTIHDFDVSKRLCSLEGSPFVANFSPTYPRGRSNSNQDSYQDSATFRDNSDQGESRWFQENLKLRKLVGKGDVSFGFKAKYQNKTIIAKIATDSDLYYSDIEIGVFRELNAAPSIPNIPQLQLAIRSMPNPFASNPKVETSISYLTDLGVKESHAEELVLKRRISVMVMKLLKKKREPKDLLEVQRFMKSLLEAMEFVHSRNIMHCDLHYYNLHWDGEMVYLFDWNGAFRYIPNKVWIHYPRTPKHMFPPEAVHNKSAVHTSVYAFDVYTIGKIMKRLLEDCCGINFEMLQKEALSVLDEIGNKQKGAVDKAIAEAAVAYELAAYMMHNDPYVRPTTTQALQHAFFTREISD